MEVQVTLLLLISHGCDGSHVLEVIMGSDLMLFGLRVSYSN